MHLILAHPAILALFGYILLNCFVAGMPEPTPTSGLAYRWLYGSLNALAVNILQIIRAIYPRLPLPTTPAPERPTP